MAKKSTPLVVPTQVGFGFEVTDIDGNPPGFLYEKADVYAALDTIQQAMWASVDVETTGLTEASVPVSLTPIDLKQGASNKVRMRTMQVRVPTVRGRSGPRLSYAFDCDKLGPSLTREVTDVVLSRPLFIAHNAGFDLYWLRRANERKTMPKMVADSMLLTRLLRPMLVLKRAELIAGMRSSADIANGTDVQKAAWKSLISGASGGSLADVVLAMFDVVVDKTFQKPGNWTGLLGFGHYDYAVDDTYWGDRIMCELLNIDEEGDIYQAYLSARARSSTIKLIEPQVPELVQLREHGVPLNQDVGRLYVKQQRKVLANKVEELLDLEPLLTKHKESLADPDAGLDDELKKSLAHAFESRGVSLRRTAATGAAQVGEKDLRACRAAQMPSSRPLFNAWVAVSRAKKASNMAEEVVGFSERSDDGKVRSLLSHGPVTGRLAAAEPNVQQWPRDQIFRAMCMSEVREGCETTKILVTELNHAFFCKVAGHGVTIGGYVEVSSAWLAALFAADKEIPDWPKEEKTALAKHIESLFTHRIVASDFGALDVRVGAALCVRAQRDMLGLAKGIAVPGPVQPPDAVVRVVKQVARAVKGSKPLTELEELTASFKKNVDRLEKKLDELKTALDADSIPRKAYFKQRSEVKEQLLAVKLGWRFSQCMGYAVARGEQDYSALRDAFVAEIDIHTFTGMKLVGRDPMKEFEGLSTAARKDFEKKLKKELGPRRQQGKIANLSLLYGMADAGFQEAAARGYDEHWTLEEAHNIRALWMDAYPEVELWHLWTEALQAGIVYLPEQGREKPVRTGWWMARTLANRDIPAFGLNAALSYQDQSTGADILGLIMHRLAVDYPHIFVCAINQVHDELVLCWEAEHHDTYLPIVEEVMVAEANSLLMPYGVPAGVSPATGVLWIKD